MGGGKRKRYPHPVESFGLSSIRPSSKRERIAGGTAQKANRSHNPSL